MENQLEKRVEHQMGSGFEGDSVGASGSLWGNSKMSLNPKP